MAPATSRSMLRRLARRLGSPWTGAIWIALIVVYLAAVSVLSETHPRLVQRLLGTAADRVYSHWLLIGLGALLCVSLIVATVTRIPLRPARAGAFCAHLGVIVLAVGAGWYVLGRVSGECLTRRTPAGWTDVDRFYLGRSAAAYVFERRDGPARQTPLAIDPPAGGERPQPLNVPLAGGPEGVHVRAEQFLPRSRLIYEWRDDAPERMPAVRLQIADGPHAFQAVIAPGHPAARDFRARGYTIRYFPEASGQQRDALLQPSQRTEEAGAGVWIVAGPQVQPTLAVRRPDGSVWHRRIERGEAAEVALAGRTVRINVVEFLGLAARFGRVAPAEGPDDPFAGPLLRVELRAGLWRRMVWLAYADFLELAGPEWVQLPGGRAVALAFSRRSKPLGGTLRVRRAEYLTYPGSVVPKDYRCEVSLLAHRRRRDETLSLNHPVSLGRYQIGQGSWRPSAEAPAEIVLTVGSRPGLPVVYAGMAMIALALPYAFYVKPLILKRRRARP